MIKNNPFTQELAREVWMMRQGDVESMMECYGQIDPVLSLSPVEILSRNSMRIEGDTAVIPIVGILMDSVPWWVRIFEDATGYDEIIENLKTAVDDPKVKNIRLEISSQGGMVSGSIECAMSIRKASEIKNVTAHISNLCASGAYLLASQAKKITCNENALVGSMGVYMTVVDSSKFAEGLGFKVTVIRSGEHKGVGVGGAEITESHIQALQKNVDSLAEIYIETVSTGRGVNKTKIRSLATGEMWVGEEAKENGLVDAIKNIIPIKSRRRSMSADKEKQEEQVTEPVNEEEVVEDPSTEPEKEPQDDPVTEPEEEPAEEEPQEPEADPEAESMNRLDALSKAFPDDAGFVLQQFRKGNTVQQAKAEKYDQHQKKTDDAEPLTHTDTDDAGGDFIQVARQVAKEKNISMTEALRQVSKEHPDLYNDYKRKK